MKYWTWSLWLIVSYANAKLSLSVMKRANPSKESLHWMRSTGSGSCLCWIERVTTMYSTITHMQFNQLTLASCSRPTSTHEKIHSTLGHFNLLHQCRSSSLFNRHSIVRKLLVNFSCHCQTRFKKNEGQ